MDIALYISDLLQKHDEVSIAGLGTFSKTRREASYDAQQDCYVPPVQQIEYKPDYFPSSMLADYISKQKNISKASSEHFIEKFTESVLNQLNTGQTADIAHLGTIHKSDEEYTFIASGNLKSDPSLFGLKPVKEIKKRVISPPDWDPVILNTVQATAEPDAESEPEIKRKFPVAIIIAAIALFGIAAVYFFSPETVRHLTQRFAAPAQNKAVTVVSKPKTITDSIAIADSIIQSLDEQGFEVEKPRDTLKISTQSAPVSSPLVTYEVIGASLNSQADAEQLVKNFKARGIDARIIHAKDKKRNNILISLGSFSNKPAASTELIRIKNDIEPGAYIYTYNNN